MEKTERKRLRREDREDKAERWRKREDGGSEKMMKERRYKRETKERA